MTVNLIITSIGFISGILNLVEAIKTQNSHATWGWACFSMYALADIFRLAQ